MVILLGTVTAVGSLDQVRRAFCNDVGRTHSVRRRDIWLWTSRVNR